MVDALRDARQLLQVVERERQRPPNGPAHLEPPHAARALVPHRHGVGDEILWEGVASELRATGNPILRPVAEETALDALVPALSRGEHRLKTRAVGVAAKNRRCYAAAR